MSPKKVHSLHISYFLFNSIFNFKNPIIVGSLESSYFLNEEIDLRVYNFNTKMYTGSCVKGVINHLEYVKDDNDVIINVFFKVKVIGLYCMP
jgi:hypothetical protein